MSIESFVCRTGLRFLILSGRGQIFHILFGVSTRSGRWRATAAVVFAGLWLAGCRGTEPAPGTRSTNADGDWTANPQVTAAAGSVTGSVTFTGPRNATRMMGMCLARRAEIDSEPVACETGSDCDAAPPDLPSGGSRYCAAPQGGGPQLCHYRPGGVSDYCVGSARFSRMPVAPGVYELTVAAPAGSHWLAMACFEACARTPHAVSKTAVVD